jgi:hypothetical protein
MFSDEIEKQKELFEEFQKPGKKLKFLAISNRFAQNKIFIMQFSIEKLIFMAIGIIVLIVFTFCFGVERGKRLVSIRPQPAQKADVEHTKVMQPELAQKTVEKIRHSQTYTIITAAYRNENFAQEIVAKMRKAGFPAYLVLSGKHFLIKVGDYKNKKQADEVLLELKKYPGYSSSYITTNR